MLRGRLRVRVVGSNTERFLNAALDRGIGLEEVRVVGNDLEGWVDLGWFRQLPSLARDAGCRLRVVGREGVPFWARSARRRPILVTGCLLFGVVVYFLATHVWFIQVDGASPAMALQVQRGAAAGGLYRGVAQGAVDPRRVEEAILRQVGGVAWAGIQREGILVRIRIVPDEKPFAHLEQPADLVAGKKARLTGIEVSAGESLVRLGEDVNKGQVLVTGNLGNGPLGRPLLVRAQGKITGRVDYRGFGEAPLRRRLVLPEAGRYRRLIIKFSEMEMIMSGRKAPPFADYLIYRHVWRITSLHVEVISLDFRQVKRKVLSFSVAQAEKKAGERALATIRRRLAPGGKLVSYRFVMLPGGKQTVKIEARAIAEEDIGMIRSIDSLEKKNAKAESRPSASGAGEGV